MAALVLRTINMGDGTGTNGLVCTANRSVDLCVCVTMNSIRFLSYVRLSLVRVILVREPACVIVHRQHGSIYGSHLSCSTVHAPINSNSSSSSHKANVDKYDLRCHLLSKRKRETS
jgi:hypothetical protein